MVNNLTSNNIEFKDFKEYKYYELDEKYIEKKWLRMDEKVNEYFKLSKEEIDTFYKKPKCIGYFSEIFENIEIIRDRHRDVSMWVSYEGDTHGGRSDMYYLCNYKRCHIEDLFCGVYSLDGLLELLYFYYKIPSKGNFWHGLSGRDYTIVLSVAMLEDIIDSINGEENSNHKEILKNCKNSCIKVLICNSTIKMSFYVLSKNASLIEKHIIIKTKLNISLSEKIIHRSNTLFTY